MDGTKCIICEEGSYQTIINGNSDFRGEIKTWWGNTIGSCPDQGISDTVVICKCNKCGNIQIFNKD